MALQTFDANDVVYSVSPEPELPLGLQTWAVLRARVLDEITGRPPDGAVSITSTFSGISPRSATGGMVGFAGIPVRAFPQLKLMAYVVPIQIVADGYILIRRNVHIPVTPNFPDAFAPVDLGDLQLHRMPTLISGRVVLNTGTAQQGVAGAVVSLTGIWRTPPPANLVVAPDPPNLVSLTPGAYWDRNAVGSQVQGLNFLGAPGPDKQLLLQAFPDQFELRLSDRHLIAPNDILAIDTADSARTEYITIQTIAGFSTDDQPATITLNSPLRWVHRPGAIVHKIQFQNVGAPTPLTQDAIAGDICLFPTNLGSLGGAPLLSIQSGPNPVEYHAAAYFQATSDAQGFFRLPAISRVAQCGLHVHDGVHTDIDVAYRPDYDDEVSRIDFVYQ